jgi:hypothetical protein
VFAIAVTALQEVLRRRVLYIVLVLLALVGLMTVSGSLFLSLASESGETEIAARISASVVSQALGLWSFATTFLAVFFGAIGFSSEVTARTIVSVLARPVDRAAYLTGRWLGMLVFLLAFQLTGILAGLALVFGLGASYAPTLWLGLAGTLVNAVLLSSVSLALSVVMPPVLAGAGAFLLPLVPHMLDWLMDSPRWIVKLPVHALFYLAPAAMPENLIDGSLSKEIVDPEYGLYARILVENLLYAGAAFALGCLVFARRQLRLR